MNYRKSILPFFIGLLCSRCAVAAVNLPFRINHVSADAVVVNATKFEIEINEFRATSPPELEFPSDFKARTCLVNGKKCHAGFRLTLVPKTRPGRVERQIYDVSFANGGKKTHYSIFLLPQTFEGYKYEGRSVFDVPLTGSMVDGLYDGNRCNLFSIAGDGRLLFFKKIEAPCIDFRPHLIRGHIFYSLELMRTLEEKGAWLGPRVILDENFKYVRQIEGEFDMHEFLLLDDNHTISIEVELGRLKTGLLFADRRVRERKNGKIVFDWGVSDLINQFDAPTVGSYFVHSGEESVAAVYHINSVQVLDENTLIVGLRETGVVCVDKKSKKVVWAFGGFIDQFGLSIKQQPIAVHTPQFDPVKNRLLLFSNRAVSSPFVNSPSRVIAYDLDIKNKKVLGFHVIRPGPEQSVLMGGVQLHGYDTYSITYGQRVDLNQNHFVEIKNEHVTFSLGFIEPKTLIYRIYREPFGEPNG